MPRRVKKNPEERPVMDDIEAVTISRHAQRITIIKNGINVILDGTFDWDPLKAFMQKHAYSIFAFSCILTLAIFGALHTPSRAELLTTNFYSTNCSGTWTNPKNAENAPDADGTFSDENSAVIAGNDPQLLCDTFSADEIPVGESLQKITVKFSWHLGALLEGEENTSSSESENVPAESIEETPVIEESPAPSPDEQVSLIKNIFSFFEPLKVSAQEESAPETPAETPAETPVETPAETPVENPQEVSEEVPTEEEPLEEDVVAEEPSEAEEEISETISEPEVSVIFEADDLLEIVYSLDGEEWKTLGAVNAENWQDASFDLVDEGIVLWSDIAKIKIGIRKISDSADTVVYLDSVYLEASYDNTPDFLKLPVVKIANSENIIVENQTGDGGQSINFIITDPQLTALQVIDLVKEQKATVVEDEAGVLDGLIPETESSSEESLIGDEESPTLIDVIQSGIENVVETIEEVVTPTPAEADGGAQIIDAVILDSDGQTTDVTVSIETVIVNGVQKQKVTILQSEREFRPGHYTLQVTLQTDTVIIITSQDFTWGVLSINPDKSIYNVGDVPYLQMGVLDNKGHTLCMADLTLQITDPLGAITTLSTDDDSIERNPQCNGDTVTDAPDYSATLDAVSETGTYAMVLTAVTANGTKIIYDRFQVESGVAFDVKRTSLTRIYPLSTYPMTITIVPESNWSGTIKETVPSSFTITPPVNSTAYNSVTTVGDEKIISWNVNLVAGQTKTLGYYFKAPDISPEFYLTGPLTFYEGAVDVWHETREWQIASDATCTSNGTGGGNWSNGASWTGCSGAGGKPGAGDNITISVGDTITMNEASAVLGTITVNGTLNTSDGTSRNLSGTHITIGATGVVTANASTITLSGNTSTIFTLTAGGTFTADTSTVTMTGNSSVGFSTTSGAITFYNLRFTPTYANTSATRIWTFGAGAITVNNDFFVSPVFNSNTMFLRVDIGLGGLTVVGTTTIQKTGSGLTTSTTLNTTASNYAFTSGKIIVGSDGIITGNSSTITLTATSGTLITNTGTITGGNYLVADNGSAVINDATLSMSNSSTLTIGGTGTETTSVGTLSVGKIVINSGATFAPATNIGLSATSGTVFTLTSGGTFTPGTSTVTFGGYGTQTLTSGVITFYNMTIAPTVSTAVTTTYTFGAGAITVTNNFSYTPNLTINHSAAIPTLVLGAGGLTVTGASTMSRTGFASPQVLMNTSSNPFSTGSLVIGSGTLVLNLSSSTFTLSGTSGTLYTNSGGTLTSTSASLVISGNGSATLNSTAMSFLNVTSSGTGTKTLGAALTVSGAMTISNGTFAQSSFAINLTGTSGTLITQSGSGALDGGTGTVTMNGNGSPTVTSGILSFYNLTFSPAQSASRNYTFGTGAVTVTNNFLITPSGGSTLTFTAILGDILTVGGTTTITRTGSSGTVTVNTTASNFALSTGKLVLGGTTNLIANTSLVTLTATSGTLITNSGTITGGSFITGNNGSAVLNATTTTLSASSILVVDGPDPVTVGATLSVGRMQLDSGSIDASGQTINITGTTTPLVTFNGGAIAGTSTVSINPNATLSGIISGNATFYNLQFFPVLGSSQTRTYTLGSDPLNITNNFTITPQGTTSSFFNVVFGSGAVTVGGLTNITRTGSSGTVSLNTSGANTAFSTGRLNVNSTTSLTLNASTLTLTGTSGTLFTSVGTVSSTSASLVMTGNGSATVNNFALTVASVISSGTGTKTLGANLTTSGEFTVSAGTFDPSTFLVTGSGTNTLNVTDATIAVGATTFAGSYSSFETRNLNSGSTVDYNRNGTQTIDSTLSYVNLATSTANTKSLNGTTNVSGTTTVTASTLDTTVSNRTLNTGSLNIASGGIVTANASAINLTGDWTNAGTFTAGTSTVTLNGGATATVTGTTTFYNLTITHSSAKQVNFATATTPIYAVSNLFTVTGNSGQLIKLRSDSLGTKFQFYPTGTASVDYLDVKDGGCEPGSITMSPTNSINSGNTDACWGLGGAQTLTFSLSDNSIGFGTLSTGAARYCSGDGVGSSSEVEAFTFDVATNAASGYVVTVQGATLTSGGNTVDAIGGTNTASSAGTEQFGLRFTATGGSGTVSSPYAASGFAYDANATTADQVASASSGDDVTTTYSARCVANIAGATPAGNYSTGLTYVVTANY